MAKNDPHRSRWIKILSTDGHIRAVAVQATELVRDLVARHGLRGVHAQALGEAAVGGVLLASYCKGGQRINLNIQGSGICRQALVDAYPDGSVRGYIVVRDESLAQRGEGETGGPWGTGMLSVLRTRETESPSEGRSAESRQPYIGTVPLLTGFLAKDLSFYWVQSEQIPSAVGIAVTLQGDEVVAAAGFLVQALPGAGSDDIRKIESHIAEIQSLAAIIAENESPLHLLGQIFQSTGFLVMEEKDLAFKCTCSMERVRRALALVGAVELKAMLDEDGSASVNCDFCAAEYRISGDELKEMISAARG